MCARRASALLSEIISGITLYFDKALGNNLLYRSSGRSTWSSGGLIPTRQ